jgi:DNA repair exonuclease SbcCD ATPase subunit
MSEGQRGLSNQNSTFFTELEPFLDQITINDFTLNGLDIQLFLSLQEQLQAKEKSLLALQTTKEHLNKQITEQTQQLIQRETEKKNLIANIASLETKIASIDTSKIEQLKQEKAKLYEEQTKLEEGVSHITFSPEKEAEKAERQKELSQPTTLSDLFALIQTLKDRGKDLANQIQLAQQQLKTLELEQKNQQRKLDQLKQAKKRLTDFEITIDQQATFSCEKIGTNCPFIKVINKQHFDQLEKQKATLREEIQQLEKQHINLSSQEEGKSEESEKQYSEATEGGLSTQIQSAKTQTEHIKTFLTTIDYKSREEKYAQKETLQKQIHEKDQTIMKLETETQKLQDYQQQKTAFQTSLAEKNQQIETLQRKKEEQTTEYQTIQQHLQQQQPEELKTHLQTVTHLLQTIHDLQQLIQDTTATKNLVKDLQHQEKLLTNLYTILSKEILLIALEEYLPVLSDIINSYLVQVVEYQISMNITETADKIELEAKIFDEKGEREVKSLSGGQRTILKLVRMLAISSYLNTPLLFLDETINNLDTDTV